jgi:hypothetical protein
MKITTILCLALTLPICAVADLNSGLVALYTFDGNGINSAGSGLNLNAHSMSYQAGLFGQAAAFNGTSGYFDTTESMPITGATSRTVDVWLYANSYWGYRNILNWGNYENGSASWALMLEAPQVGTAVVDAHWLILTSESHPNAYGTGSWFNLAITYDGTSHAAHFYLNGVDIGSVVSMGDPADVNTASAPMTVGNVDPRHTPYSDAWYSPWYGMMDNLRIYDRALTGEEIAQLATVPEPSMVTLWLLAATTLAVRQGRRPTAAQRR